MFLGGNGDARVLVSMSDQSVIFGGIGNDSVRELFDQSVFFGGNGCDKGRASCGSATIDLGLQPKDC